jgi:radical SAM protein with 4Fe4S-binding SPASM domain
MKASFHLKSMQIINKDSYGSWLPSLGKFSRYEKTDNGYTLKNPFPNKCSRLWFNPVITWDGKVLPCCFDKNADHVMGDLNEDPFTEIWNDPRYKMFRRSVLSDRKIIEICRNCTSGLKLKLS